MTFSVPEALEIDTKARRVFYLVAYSAAKDGRQESSEQQIQLKQIIQLYLPLC